jgi:hypothetical protein
MKDLQKIKEFFFKPLEKAIKEGDKITYLGHPGVITAVNKKMTGDIISYTVSYDKGTGKTTASNIYNKGGEIKLAGAMNFNDPVSKKSYGKTS